MKNEIVWDIPVAIAAPATPFCIGKINSQSRNILISDDASIAIMASIGEPSFLQKNWNMIARDDGIMNAEY